MRAGRWKRRNLSSRTSRPFRSRSRGRFVGTFFPLSQAPRLLAFFSKLTPHAWFLQGLGDLSAGDGLEVVVLPAFAMLAFFVVTIAVAVVFGRERVLAP